MTVESPESTGVSDGRRTRARLTAPMPFSRLTILPLAVNYAILPILVIAVVVCSLIYSQYLSIDNVRTMLTENAPLGLIAAGETFTILVGCFDLSVASTFALSSVIYATWSNNHSLVVAAIVALASGVVVGLVNGILVTKIGVNSFITTLATSSAVGGIAYIYSHSEPVNSSNPSMPTLAGGQWGPFPIDVVLLVAVFVAAETLLRVTKFGQAIYATGGNINASKLAGIRIDGVRTAAFCISGLLSATAGLIIASRLLGSQASVSGSMTLDAITIVIIGGTSLHGGEGSIWRTGVGLLIIASLTDVLQAKAIDQNWQDIVTGVVLIASVGLDVLSKRAGRLSVPLLRRRVN